MSSGRLVFPGPRGIVVLRSDERLVLLSARAAAASRGRQSLVRLLPVLPGRPTAVGFEGRWTIVRVWRDGESLSVRIPPVSDDLELRSLGAAPEPEATGLDVLTEAGDLSPAGEEGEAGPCLRLGGAEPVTARESAAGAWTVRSLRAEVGMSLPEGCRVVSPARLETELGLATLEQRVLSFIGAAGSVRRTILDLDAEATAPCQGAPWLALLEGQSVSLRELGARWGRRLGSWSLPAT